MKVYKTISMDHTLIDEIEKFQHRNAYKFSEALEILIRQGIIRLMEVGEKSE